MNKNISDKNNLKKRLLIFIVAYNAQLTLREVLDDISPEIFKKLIVEILIIDDASEDAAHIIVQGYKNEYANPVITFLRNPVKSSYGACQKLAFEYAIQNNFDIVSLLHANGKYPANRLWDLVRPICEDNMSFVFGSRLKNNDEASGNDISPQDTPFYKIIANQILTFIQNKILNTKLTEFHSGFRAYKVEELKCIPYERNSDEYHFDTQVLIQLLKKGVKYEEISIPGYHGEELQYVKGLNYALNVLKTTFLSRIHDLSILYQREYDLGFDNTHYTAKLGYVSSHSLAIESVRNNTKVLDIGCNQGFIAREIKKKNCWVAGVDYYPVINSSCIDEFSILDLNKPELLPNISNFDHVLMLDVIEHVENPEHLLDVIREKSGRRCPILTITTGNIAFIIIRLQLLFSQFNYGKQGILDMTHKRLFTFGSLKRILGQCGYDIIKIRGIPAPFPKAIGANFISKILIGLNLFFIKFSKSLFSYQIYIEAVPRPVTKELLKYNLSISKSSSTN